MSRIKCKDTSCEILLRDEIRKRGIKYKKNDYTIFGNPDIVVKDLKIAVFCDSEFWHGKKYKEGEIPTSNRTFWENKFKKNIDRDKLVNRTLRKKGWKVIRFWEKDIKNKTSNCAEKIQGAINIAMKNKFPYVEHSSDGKPQINKKNSFCGGLEYKIPQPDASFSELFNILDSSLRLQDGKITQSALNNCHGDWYEWLLAIAAWNYHCDNPDAHIAVLLPNITKFDVARLYTEDLFLLIDDLRKKVKNATSVQMITSNPDFVIIDPERIKIPKIFSSRIQQITRKNLELIDTSYSYFKGRCEFNDIVGYISVKTSLRPDRRLQMPHEGSLMKALYTHLQTRKWILDPRGLKYYAIASEVGEADKKALKTVATHSITTVHDKPQPAVDDIFKIGSFSEAEGVFGKILTR